LVTIEQIVKNELKKFINESDVKPSKLAVDNICNSKKFCDAQGEITFGQLRALVDSATNKRLFKHIGEGGYKATLRLLPWFIPQLAVAGFIASSIRAVNKILKPALTETETYKTWWGKAILKSFDLSEGELNLSDPLSKIFFISDGLMTMLDEKYKIKFAHYIATLASEQPDDQVVPEFFVENELRNWLNDKFLLNPPLQPKVSDDDVSELPFEQKIEEGYKIRTFNSKLDSEELKWHFDETDREVIVMESKGWMFQMDNELPIFLKEGDKIFVPKGVYHRVLKGDGKLKVKIKEIY
jgi:hypothetical protein